MTPGQRKPLIVGNWKLNKTIRETVSLITLLKRQLSEVQSVEIAVCPPFTALSDASEILVDSNIRLGAQDLFWEERGAFTGEVSASLLKDVGADFVIIGHSERRQFFHETNELVNKKTKSALNAGLIPVVCVGETLEEREHGKTFKVIEQQLGGCFAHFSTDEMGKAVIAYEPVWAIGTGKVATPAQAEDVHAFIRKEISKLSGEEIARNLRILYGGSVKPDNIASLMNEVDIDGALVGGASLEADGFSQIVKNASVISVR